MGQFFFANVSFKMRRSNKYMNVSLAQLVEKLHYI
jgi:hypothetical protein